MHIGQSVLITYCFGLNSWKLSQVACALVIFLVKSKFSQVWILSIDYRQYISLFYHSWLISANLKVYFQESSISFHFAISLETARKYCRHQNRWCGKWYSADPQFPVTTSRTLTMAAWEKFTREFFREIFTRDRFLRDFPLGPLLCNLPPVQRKLTIAMKLTYLMYCFFILGKIYQSKQRTRLGKELLLKMLVSRLSF